jgi:hypothetical protein
MFWNRAISDILSSWQYELDAKLEAGETPLLNVGMSNLPLGMAPGLLALQALIARRVDVAAPVIVAGGNSPAWLATLVCRPRRASWQSPEPSVLFAGADAATYMATLSTLASETAAASARFGELSTPLALGASWQFAPQLHPGAPMSWDSLPFIACESSPARAMAHRPSTHEFGAELIAWGAMVFTVLLILTAIFI